MRNSVIPKSRRGEGVIRLFSGILTPRFELTIIVIIACRRQRTAW